MKFNLLLLVLYLKLKHASRYNHRFIKFIKDKNLKFVIKTAKGKPKREYSLLNGKVKSGFKNSDSADFTMVWSDSDIGFKTMSSKNEEAAIAALTEEKLEVEGDLKEFMWFSRAIEIMTGKA